MLQLLKRSFLWIVLAGLVFYVAVERPTLFAELHDKYFAPQPCANPIGYKLGSFDERFGVSREDFLKTVSSAADIWGKGMNKNLFVYDPKGALTINLVYDSRQQSTQKNALLQANVDKISGLAASVRAQYASFEEQYRTNEMEYKSQIAAYSQAEEKYNRDVSYWNSRGGAPHSQYDVLNQQRTTLIAMQASIERKRVEINGLADKINAFIKQYNLLVSDANSKIRTINATSGEFEEGLYDPNTHTVTIFQFDTKTRLLRVLAHELGHALGLDHNSNPKSIMYAYNIDTNDTISKEDAAALFEKCSAK